MENFYSFNRFGQRTIDARRSSNKQYVPSYVITAKSSAAVARIYLLHIPVSGPSSPAVRERQHRQCSSSVYRTLDTVRVFEVGKTPCILAPQQV